MAFPIALGSFLFLPVLVKIIHHPAFGKPVAVFIDRTQGKQYVGMGIAVALVVNGDIGEHTLRDELG